MSQDLNTYQQFSQFIGFFKLLSQKELVTTTSYLQTIMKTRVNYINCCKVFQCSAFSKSARHPFTEPPPLEVYCHLPVGKWYYDNDETHGMPFVIWQGAEKITNYAIISSGKMRQLCRKQTGLCRQISTVAKIDKSAFWMYQITMKQKALHGITQNFSSLIECTSFLPSLTFA